MSAVYDRIGATYARYRRPDPRIAAQIDRALGDAKLVLNVGGGTGSYETGSRRYVAAEPSAVMLGQRDLKAAPAVRAVAERLPFRDGSFDAAIAIHTVHHWTDAAGGLAEVRRVTSGPIVILTWLSDYLTEMWLVRDYIPAAAFHDQSLVSAIQISDLLPGCQVETVPIPHDCTDGFFAAYWRRPEMYLDPDARGSISGLALLPADVLERMVVELRADLDTGVWHRRHAQLLNEESRDYGYRLVISPGAARPTGRDR